MTGEIERRKAKLLVVFNCHFGCSSWLNLLRAEASPLANGVQGTARPTSYMMLVGRVIPCAPSP